MIVYHGTTEIIKLPDVRHSKKYLDFGMGFYLTTYEEQAKKWAVRRGMRQEKTAIVNVYDMEDNWENTGYCPLKKKMKSGWNLFVHAEKEKSEIKAMILSLVM